MIYQIKYRSKDEMKDSGIEWIGSIPKDWRLTKLKFVINEFITGGTPSSSNENYYTEFEKGTPWISIGDMSTTSVINKTKSSLTRIGLRSKNLKILKRGTLIYSIFATLGKVSEINIDATTNQAILGLNNNELLANKGYLKYWLINLEKYLKYYSSSNTQENLNTNKVRNFNFLDLRNIENQKKIANFLDLKTAEFDSIISKKELLIERLEEAKKSLISEVVTGKVKIVDGELIERKADEMRDSGVEWLGMIPKDWEVKRLKYLIKINPIKSEVRKNNLKCSFVPMNKIGRGTIILDEERLVSQVYDGYTYFKNKDIIMAKVTPCFENGNIAIADNLTNGIAFGTTEINVFRATNINLNFLYYIFQESHFMNYAVNHMTGVAGLKRIPTTYFENYYIALPKREEQKLISEYIIRLFGNIDKIEHKTKLQIQKLKQAKQSLISEAVTGKIDLRDWEIREI